SNNKSYVVEYYCQPNSSSAAVNSTWIECPYGCDRGACIQPSCIEMNETGINDSQYGISILGKDHYVLAAWDYCTTCSGKECLKEKYCNAVSNTTPQDYEILSKNFECDCEVGECIGPLQPVDDNTSRRGGGGSRSPGECSDKIDNDGDGLIDYPDDPGCTGYTDNYEINAVIEGTNITCLENWLCGGWGACVDGKQQRTCFDANRCGTTEETPSLEKSCVSAPPPPQPSPPTPEPPAPRCGDGTCNEDPATCPADCPPPAPVCGDNKCDPGEIDTCLADCPPPEEPTNYIPIIIVVVVVLLGGIGLGVYYFWGDIMNLVSKTPPKPPVR
ncbi:hypothetical protein ACFLZX_06570, partial [Nanoarchaeota archaeon]